MESTRLRKRIRILAITDLTVSILGGVIHIGFLACYFVFLKDRDFVRYTLSGPVGWTTVSIVTLMRVLLVYVAHILLRVTHEDYCAIRKRLHCWIACSSFMTAVEFFVAGSGLYFMMGLALPFVYNISVVSVGVVFSVKAKRLMKSEDKSGGLEFIDFSRGV